MDFIKQDIEEYVLGGYMVGHHRLNESDKAELAILMSAKFFSSAKNSKMFAAIQKCIARGSCDNFAVDAECDGQPWYENNGGHSWLLELLRVGAMPQALLGYSKTLKEAYVQREAHQIALNLIDSLKQYGDHQNKVDLVTQSASDITSLMTDTRKKPKTIAQGMDEILDDINNRIESGGLSGLKVGIKAIDEAMGKRGIGETDLIIIGARAKTGKTLLSLAMAGNVGRDKKPVLFLSLEMQAKELVLRLMCQQSGMNPQDIYQDNIEENNEFWAKFTAAMSAIKDSPITIEDTPQLKIQQIAAIAKQHAAQHGKLALIVVDYLQICGINKHGRHDLAIGEISLGLKVLAKELKTPIVALSQLNRNGKGKPNVTHLRESGQIEQDADAIFLIHNLEEDDSGNPIGSLVEINMPVYRHGPSAGPFYMDKKGGKMRDADKYDAENAVSRNQASQQPQRPSGFAPKGFGQ